jgi:hypothetical protein
MWCAAGFGAASAGKAATVNKATKQDSLRKIMELSFRTRVLKLAFVHD